MVRAWQTTMDTSNTTVFRRRGSNGSICCISITIIAVITGIYVTIVSVLRFGRFLVGFNNALPFDNDLLPSVSRKSQIGVIVVCNEPAVFLIVHCYLLSITHYTMILHFLCKCVQCNKNIIGVTFWPHKS